MTHSALVRWLSPNERGKVALPPTLRYVGLSRFPGDRLDGSTDMWSVELRFVAPPPESVCSDISEATVRFLFDAAPQERLNAGARFELYEGNTKVADVDVLD